MLISPPPPSNISHSSRLSSMGGTAHGFFVPLVILLVSLTGHHEKTLQV